MSITITVNGQNGPGITATSGDTVGVSVGSSSSYGLSVTQAGTPGGTGPQGPAGPPYTTVDVGNTTTLAAGSNATVTAVSTNSGANLTLNFGIPTGATGATPTIVAGTTTTLAAGASATVSAATKDGTVTLNFGIPQGAAGSGGATVSSSTPLNLGTAAAGTSAQAARSDHVHNLPVIAYSNLSGIPSNFPTNATLVSGLSASYAPLIHAHNYVTGLNGLAGSLNLAAGANVTITATNSSTLTIDTKGIGANDAIDGGNYVGEVLQSITFTTQPQSQNVSLGSTLNWTSGTNTSRQVFSLGSQMLGVNVAATYNGVDQTWSASANLATYANAAGSPAASASVSGLTLQSGSFSASVAYNGTRTLAQLWQAVVSNGSTTYLQETLRSDDNGSTWARLSVPRPSQAIAGGPLGFVSDAYDSSGVALQSSDGATWNTRTMPFDPSVAVSPWRFAVGGVAVVGVANDSTRVARSTTGVSWSSVTLGANAYASNVVFGNGRFVAIGGATGNKSYTSTDGSTWTNGNLPSADYRKIFYAGGRFLALRDATTSDAAVSTDGVTWSLQTLPSSSNWRTAAAAGNYYAIAEYNGTSAALFTTAGEPTAGSANLTVAAVASTGATVGYQWQRSVDVGTTWANVANANTGAINVANITLNDNGTRYRVLATATGVPSAYSSTALLTVN